jgi:hypothetical protein
MQIELTISQLAILLDALNGRILAVHNGGPDPDGQHEAHKALWHKLHDALGQLALAQMDEVGDRPGRPGLRGAPPRGPLGIQPETGADDDATSED